MKLSHKLLFSRQQVQAQRRLFSGNMFSKKLQELKKQTRRETMGEKEAEQARYMDETQGKWRLDESYDEKREKKHIDREAEMVSTLDIDGVLSHYYKNVKDNQGSNDFYKACFERIDFIILERQREERIAKEKVLEILRALTYYRPNELIAKEHNRLNEGNFTEQEQNENYLSERHQQLMHAQQNKNPTAVQDGMAFLNEHFVQVYFKNFLQNQGDESSQKLLISLRDVHSSYQTLFHNLEIRTIEFLNKNQMTGLDSLDALIAFSIGQAGTNTLFMLLINEILSYTRRNQSESYTVTEIELILNYFPHVVFKEHNELRGLEIEFYKPLHDKILSEISRVSNRQFLSLFQGSIQASFPFFSVILLKEIEQSFLARLQKLSERTKDTSAPSSPEFSFQDEEKQQKLTTDQELEVEQILVFLELLVKLKSTNQQLFDQIEVGKMVSGIFEESSVRDSQKELSFNQIAGFLWILRRIGFGSETQMFDFFEDRMIELMEEELQLQKYLEKNPEVEDEMGVGLQNLSVGDVKSVQDAYFSGCGGVRKKHINKLLKKMVYWDQPEKERKWFHF